MCFPLNHLVQVKASLPQFPCAAYEVNSSSYCLPLQ